MKKKQNSPKALSLLGYLFCANSVRDFKGCVKTQKIISSNNSFIFPTLFDVNFVSL